MIKIRRCVFETNSSSTHSICITKNSNLVMLPEKIVFKLGNFGWEENVFYDVEHKASYLFTAIHYIDKYFSKKDAQKYLDYIQNVLIKNNIDFEFDQTKTEYYIDHMYELIDFVKAVCHSEKRLLRYLFSVESFIMTGNDNDDTPIDIYVSYKHEEYYKNN